MVAVRYSIVCVAPHDVNACALISRAGSDDMTVARARHVLHDIAARGAVGARYSRVWRCAGKRARN